MTACQIGAGCDISLRKHMKHLLADAASAVPSGEKPDPREELLEFFPWDSRKHIWFPDMLLDILGAEPASGVRISLEQDGSVLRLDSDLTGERECFLPLGVLSLKETCYRRKLAFALVAGSVRGTADGAACCRLELEIRCLDGSGRLLLSRRSGSGENLIFDYPEDTGSVMPVLVLTGSGSAGIRAVARRPCDFMSTHLVSFPSRNAGEPLMGRLWIHEPADPDAVTVVFSPGVQNTRVFPQFNRHTYFRELEGYRIIALADPYNYSDVIAGSMGSWHIGLDGRMLLEDYAWAIRSILGNSRGPLVVFGSSMGGYASIILSDLLDADLCIAHCFQADLTGYLHSRRWLTQYDIPVQKPHYLRISSFLNLCSRMRTRHVWDFFSCDSGLESFFQDYALVRRDLLGTADLRIIICNDLVNRLTGHTPRTREDEIAMIRRYVAELPERTTCRNACFQRRPDLPDPPMSNLE